MTPTKLPPRAERPAIVLLGLRNAGKSSLMNGLLGREVSIVSPEAGTTTDPVARAIELGRLGPATLHDTAGLDDGGELGDLRVARSRAVIETAAAHVLVSPGDRPPLAAEVDLGAELSRGGKPLLVALTFADRTPSAEKTTWAEGLGAAAVVRVDNAGGKGAETLREALAGLSERLLPEAGLFDGLVTEGDLVLLVTPVDLGAPKGRLILPQVEAIRDLLDRDCQVLVVKEREVAEALGSLARRPRLVVTDSQAFAKVAADIPEDWPLTGFSVLLARKKGDLGAYLAGIQAIETLPEGARVLVLEACSHHRQAEDLGTVKIPRLLRQLHPRSLSFDFTRELPPPAELAGYDLAITCGACMRTRLEVLGQLSRLEEAGVAVTNYGIFLAWANGLLERSVAAFPELAAPA